MNAETQPTVAGPVEPTVRPVAEKLRSAAARTTRTNAEVALLCEYALQAAAELDRMADALGRLRKWGDMGDGYSAGLMMDVRDWIDGGMAGELPPMPEWAVERLQAIERMNRRA